MVPMKNPARTMTCPVWRLFQPRPGLWAVCVLFFLLSPAPARGAAAGEGPVIVPGYEKLLSEVLTPPDTLLPEGVVLDGFEIRRDEISLNFLERGEARPPVAVRLADRGKEGGCMPSGEITLCPEEAAPSWLATYSGWLVKSGRDRRVAEVWSGQPPAGRKLYGLIWLVLWLAVLGGSAWLGGRMRASSLRPGLRRATGRAALGGVLLLSAAAAIGACLRSAGAESLYPDTWWSPVLLAAAIAALFLSHETKGSGRAAVLISAALIALAATVPQLDRWPQAGYEVERLVLARGDWLAAFGGDGRHPFVFFWLLKAADAIFGQPEALHAVGLAATVAAAAVIVCYFSRVADAPLGGLLIALVMLLSPAYLKYGADPGPFPLWMMLSVWLIFLLESGRMRPALLVFIIAAYTEYVAWLFLPWFLTAYREREGRLPHPAYGLALLPSLALAVRGLLGDLGTPGAKMLDKVGIVWDSADLTTMAGEGLAYLSPGGLKALGIAMILAAFIFCIAELRARKRISSFLLLLPPVALLVMSLFARIRPEYFSALFPLLICWTFARLIGTRRHRSFETAIVALTAMAVVYAFLVNPCIHERSEPHPLAEMTRMIAKERDVWLMDESATRLFAYYSDHEAVGRGACVAPDYFNAKRRLHTMFGWGSIAVGGSDARARRIVRSWREAESPFVVLVDGSYRSPEVTARFIRRHCIERGAGGRLTAYLCDPRSE